MHVYHFAPYEPGAFKRLMGRYGTREEEVDQMLRGNLFVDLYRTVRGALRASVESYSIKELEKFFDFEREVDLRNANSALYGLAVPLELGDPDSISDEDKETVEAYNRDDCFSTLRLRSVARGDKDRSRQRRQGDTQTRGPGPTGLRNSHRVAADDRGAGRPHRRGTCRRAKRTATTNSRPGGFSPTHSTGTGARTRPSGGNTSV